MSKLFQKFYWKIICSHTFNIIFLFILQLSCLQKQTANVAKPFISRRWINVQKIWRKEDTLNVQTLLFVVLLVCWGFLLYSISWVRKLGLTRPMQHFSCLENTGFNGKSPQRNTQSAKTMPTHRLGFKVYLPCDQLWRLEFPSSWRATSIIKLWISVFPRDFPGNFTCWTGPLQGAGEPDLSVLATNMAQAYEPRVKASRFQM